MRMNLCWSQLCSRWVQNLRLGYNLLFDMLNKRLLPFCMERCSWRELTLDTCPCSCFRSVNLISRALKIQSKSDREFLM
jgi:hypothetical protein